MKPNRLHLLSMRLLLLAAGFCGNAVHAQVLDVPLKFTYKGAIVARAYASPSDGCVSAYTVPAGVSARITDFMLANYSSTTAALPNQYLCSGTSSCTNYLTSYIVAPAGSTLVNNYNSGLRLDPGTQLFACNAGGTSSGTAEWTFNGFTYTNP